jgi:hypothetical protein
MDHADVLELIEAAVAGPGGLARLGGDPSPEAAAVRAHIAACPRCAAEWRAWSVVSMGMAAAAPDTLEPRAGLRDQVLAAAAQRPRAAPSPSAAAAPARAGVEAPGRPAHAEPPTRSGIRMGPRGGRATPRAAQAPATSASGHLYRWLLLGAAAAIALFVAGAVLGGRFATVPGPTPGTAVGSPAAPRGDPGRVLSEMAVILQDGGYRLASLQTPEGDAGGVVAVSPDGRLAVVSPVLEQPPEGVRYLCLLDRGGTVTQVGYMRWEPTASGGSLAYWAGDATPPDLGLPGDLFIVQLDQADAVPALAGEFLG